MFRSSNDVWQPNPITEKDDSENESYGCDYCSDEHASETETEVHRRSIHMSELCNLIYNPAKCACKTCVIEFSSPEDLLKHIKTIHLLSSENCLQVEKEIYVCDHCHHIFFNKQLLAAHIAHVHYTDDSLRKYIFVECPKCNKGIRLSTLWVHVQNHQVMSVSCCPVCLLKQNSRKDMLRHVHKTHQNKYICSKCGYDTQKERFFSQHVEKHGKALIEAESEDGIDHSKYFIPKMSMQWKCRQNPYGMKGYYLQDDYKICILCKQICLGQKHMNYHILYDHQPEVAEKKNTYTCSCGEEFSNKILLKHHVFKLKGTHQVVDTVKVQDSTEIFYFVVEKESAS